MSKRQVIIILGIWIFLLPFLGIPLIWIKFLTVCSGILVAIIASSMKPKNSSEDVSGSHFTNSSMPYVEHKSASVAGGLASPAVSPAANSATSNSSVSMDGIRKDKAL